MFRYWKVHGSNNSHCGLHHRLLLGKADFVRFVANHLNMLVVQKYRSGPMAWGHIKPVQLTKAECAEAMTVFWRGEYCPWAFPTSPLPPGSRQCRDSRLCTLLIHGRSSGIGYIVYHLSSRLHTCSSHAVPRLTRGCWHASQSTVLRAKYGGTYSNTGLSCALTPSSSPLQQPPPKLLLLSFVLLLSSVCRAAPVCLVWCSNARAGTKHSQVLAHLSRERQPEGGQPAIGTGG